MNFHLPRSAAHFSRREFHRYTLLRQRKRRVVKNHIEYSPATSIKKEAFLKAMVLKKYAEYIFIYIHTLTHTCTHIPHSYMHAHTYQIPHIPNIDTTHTFAHTHQIPHLPYTHHTQTCMYVHTTHTITCMHTYHMHTDRPHILTHTYTHTHISEQAEAETHNVRRPMVQTHSLI